MFGGGRPFVDVPVYVVVVIVMVLETSSAIKTLVKIGRL